MWFRLLTDYKTHEDENTKISILKRGAPIEVKLHFTEKKEIRSEFIFSPIGEIKHLDISSLELPGYCVKDRFGNAFCATKNTFFKANLTFYGDYVARQLKYCPTCGKKLKQQFNFPKKENLEKYTKMRKPLDDSILVGLDISCGR